MRPPNKGRLAALMAQLGPPPGGGDDGDGEDVEDGAPGDGGPGPGEPAGGPGVTKTISASGGSLEEIVDKLEDYMEGGDCPPEEKAQIEKALQILQAISGGGSGPGESSEGAAEPEKGENEFE